MKKLILLIVALISCSVAHASLFIQQVNLDPGTCGTSDQFSITFVAAGGTGGPYTYTIYNATGSEVVAGPSTTGIFEDLAQGTYTYSVSDEITTVGPNAEETSFSVSASPISFEIIANPACLGDTASLIVSSSGGPVGFLDAEISVFNVNTGRSIPVPSAPFSQTFDNLRPSSFTIQARSFCSSDSQEFSINLSLLRTTAATGNPTTDFLNNKYCPCS